jgi:hypothetical protein
MDFASPTEDQNGNLYVVGRGSQTIYKSTNNGVSWAAVPKGSMENDFGFYIDNNGWFYKIKGDASTGSGLFVSKNAGATYTQLINVAYDLINQFSVQTDGNYYYENTGLYQSVGITSNVKLIWGQLTSTFFPYILAQNGNLITTRNGTQVVYLPK